MLECTNPNCPEYQIPKDNPSNLANVVCGSCGQPVTPQR